MNPNLFLGFALGVSVGVLAWRVRALTANGAAAAALVGGLIFGLGGLAWAVLLLTFFISSSGLSLAFNRRKLAAHEKFAKGSRRDWGQVLANGGLGALLVIADAAIADPGQVWPYLAFAGAMAAVNADTWATELGVLSPTPPRLITTRQVVEPGSSGGVTGWGTLAALGGAALIGLAGGLFASPVSTLPLVFITAAAGLAGAMLDSLLGATVQVIYSCPACGKLTERHPIHHCGTQTTYARGWRWLNNDLVNLAASLTGAVIAVLLSILLL
jgi:uncharacterized protein (TIGR00297 family)